jgi:hypothetical protein
MECSSDCERRISIGAYGSSGPFMCSLDSLIRVLAPLLLVVHIECLADGTRFQPPPVAALQSSGVHQSNGLAVRIRTVGSQSQELQATQGHFAIRNSSDPRIQLIRA